VKFLDFLVDVLIYEGNNHDMINMLFANLHIKLSSGFYSKESRVISAKIEVSINVPR